MRYILHRNPESEQIIWPADGEFSDPSETIKRMDGYDSNGKPFLGFPLPIGWSAWFNKKTGGMFFAVPPELPGRPWQITEPVADYNKFIRELLYAVKLSQHDLRAMLARDRLKDKNVESLKKPFFFNRFLGKLSKQKEIDERISKHNLAEQEKIKYITAIMRHEMAEKKMHKDYRDQYMSWKNLGELGKESQPQIKKNPRKPIKRKVKKTAKKNAKKK